MLGILCLGILGGCIENDIPYPRISQNITSLSAEGEIKVATIDTVSCCATVYLGEEVDIEKVKFNRYTVTPGAESTPDLIEGSYNLSAPLSVTLHRWFDYEWKVIADQQIERYFNVQGAVGESVINPEERTVTVIMPKGTDTSDLVLESVKLGPSNITTLVPDLKAGIIDLSKPMKVEVTAFARTEIWTISVELTDLIVSTDNVDAWSKVIWAYGSGPSDVKNGFQYRESFSDKWIDVQADRVTQNQGTFSCSIPHLQPLTSYQVRAISGSNVGNVVTVTTQGTADIPNGDFENWCQIGKIIYPFAEDGDRFWDTGNTGTATMGQNLTVSSDNTSTGSGKSAQLTTKFIGLFGIGKLAAGSIFSGKFMKVDGTNGILNFGQPWTLRPTRLKGAFQYKGVNINYASSEMSAMKNQPDTCIVYVALTDWTAPYEIRTNPSNRQLFDKNASYVIGYGEMQYSGTMESFQEFDIDIKYRSTSIVPRYILITASSSKYGDYFTGGSGSVMWIDQLSLGWDLDK